ncbi:2,5-diketo-D-gluconic acid reductase [Campylobacter hyointestinalis subsp. hyointestinalis]|nr:2,5-diketo-D-gluconic acid reductase [Campylobacter hyointestinalis subsp. hyointestinalis]PPB75070.1 2,5-diketo-D-gluconic acid reductase [Campylobacter hyointestinalis subsp. hyointestinalis]PPB77752.1 2,5-diketo-D-gluconic acid reductase [Campylobacter hyointestinalis subsp. hyointestinalis]PPB78831.1 2,5-diketo-D-gluconic acid reductase [Campylobacter hyointestinalis subsp. hyointestinalis]TWO22543.1 aldo/keto reductase [Campylobacter hyointestinalis]
MAAGFFRFGGSSLFANTTKINQVPFATLNNGVKMPMLGLGVLGIKDLKECQRVVEDALEIGYRLIDTAQSYTNEAGVGMALKATGVKRDEIFVNTKLFKENAVESKVEKSFDESLKRLNIDYLDSFLIHQPINDTYGAWRAMSKLYEQKKVRAIGVSNFYTYRLMDFVMNNEIKPAINQVECHPYHQQVDAQKLMKTLGIQMEAWSPFMQARQNILQNEVLVTIGKKYNKSAAQVILRWLNQRDIITIPKTTKKERLIENISIFDFSLSDTDMALIATLERTKPLFNHHDPEKIKWLNERKAGESVKG